MEATSPLKRVRSRPENDSDDETLHDTRTPLYESPDKKSRNKDILQSGISETGTSTLAQLRIDTPLRETNGNSFYSTNSSPRTPGLGK